MTDRPPWSMTMSLELSKAWGRAYPGAAIGILVMTDVRNSAPGPALQARVRSIEESLRAAIRGSHDVTCMTSLRFDRILTTIGGLARRTRTSAAGIGRI